MTLRYALAAVGGEGQIKAFPTCFFCRLPLVKTSGLAPCILRTAHMVSMVLWPARRKPRVPRMFMHKTSHVSQLR